MKHFLIFIILMCLVMNVDIVAKDGDKSSAAKNKNIVSATTRNVYPIAPGAWYPGDGSLPEKPMHYRIIVKQTPFIFGKDYANTFERY